MADEPPSKQIDAIIAKSGDWRGEMLARLRAIVLDADSGIVEAVKWKKPSKPEGVTVWELGGILCVGETLKNAVRLTFPKGALVKDLKQIFNTRLDSKSVRAVDFHEGEAVDEPALQTLIREAVELNTSKLRNR
jgi:hypothetical protein